MMEQQRYQPTASDRGNPMLFKRGDGEWVPRPESKNQGLPFWAQVLLVIVLIASFCLNIGQAYYKHLFEQGWEDCPSHLVYEGTCIPMPDSVQQGANT